MGLSYRCEDYMYSNASVAPPKIDTHSHKYYELLHFINGDAAYVVGDRIYRAEPGDLFVTAPGQEHMITFNSDKPYERSFIQVSPKLMSRVPDNLSEMLRVRLCGQCNRINAQIVKQYRLHKYFQAVHECLENKTPSSDFMTRTYILQLIVKIGEIREEELAAQQIDKKIILDMKKFINDKIDSPITLDMIAAEFFMSKYYLCHKFHSETGMTIKNYINVQRIAKARELLALGMSAADVPKLCGFNDYSTFYRTFRRYTGHSPKDCENY